MDIVLSAIVMLGTLAPIAGLAAVAILGPHQKRFATELRIRDSLRRRALVDMAQAHTRARH